MTIVKETIIAELQQKTVDAVRFKQLMTDSKTSTKRKVYEKKLHKNNKEAMSLIVALERLNKQYEYEYDEPSQRGASETS